jgi:catechol 2,3-dioxygenase-like lactoylglutathione lyase family enzyme
MLSEAPVIATIAVRDIEIAKNFYGGTLGLRPLDEDPGGVMYQCKGSTLFVYPSQFAGSNQATYASWNVQNIEMAVNDLKAKGVTFEHYDMPGAMLQGDVHVMEGTKAAWFRDPDGNILALTSM